MADNPYAHYPAEQRRFEGDEPAGESRLSLLALVALLLSIPACCVPLLGVGAGPIAAILGVIALLVISRSQGRLHGNGLAASGVFLGIISAVLWGAVGFGAYTAFTWYRDQPVATTANLFQAIQDNDFAKARVALSEPASKSLTDDDLRAFRDAASASLGVYKSAPIDFALWGDAFKDAYSGKQKPAQGGNTQSNSPPFPVALQFDKQLSVAYATPDMARMQAGGFLIDDIFVILADGRGLTLRKDGPIKAFADAASLGAVHASELAPAGAPAANPGESPQAPPAEPAKPGEPEKPATPPAL